MVCDVMGVAEREKEKLGETEEEAGERKSKEKKERKLSQSQAVCD